VIVLALAYPPKGVHSLIATEHGIVGGCMGGLFYIDRQYAWKPLQGMDATPCTSLKCIHEDMFVSSWRLPCGTQQIMSLWSNNQLDSVSQWYVPCKQKSLAPSCGWLWNQVQGDPKIVCTLDEGSRKVGETKEFITRCIFILFILMEKSWIDLALYHTCPLIQPLACGIFLYCPVLYLVIVILNGLFVLCRTLIFIYTDFNRQVIMY
jgi:hypothetical protein